MASNRERELQRAREARLKEEKAASNRRRLIAAAVAVAVIAVIGGIAFAASNSDETPSGSGFLTPAPSPTRTATSADCKAIGDLQTEAQQFPDGSTVANLPPSTYGLSLETNCGKIEVTLDAAGAPLNSAAMIFLANTGASQCEPLGAECGGDNPNGKIVKVQGYFDNTTCHRLTTSGIFVLQCGDPTGTGTGNPGFTTVDEGLAGVADNFADAGDGRVIYPRGAVAMANSGPNTNGSQFFLVYNDSPLPPDYTVVGQITSGLEIVDLIAEGGSTPSGDGAPNDQLELVKVNSFERRPIDS